MRIRNQIMATLGLVTLLPTAALVVVSHERSAAAIGQSADQALQALASHSAAHLKGYLSNRLEEVQGLSAMPVFSTFLSQETESHQRTAALDLLHNLHGRDGSMSIACGLLDRRGMCVLDAHTAAFGKNESHHDYFRQINDSELPWAGHAEWVDSPWPVVVFASAIRDTEGRLVGALRLVVESSKLQQLLTDADIREVGSTMVLLDANGRVVADARSPERSFGNARIDIATVRNTVSPVRPTKWFAPGASRATDGLSTTTQVGNLPWQLMVWQDADAHGAPTARLLKGTIFQGCLAFALLLLGAAIASRLVAAPILRLEQTARWIAEGNLDVPIPIGTDEIGSLGRTLQLMKDRLLAAMSDLEQTAVNAKVASQAKSQFLANMSHELRTPMNAIIGYAEIIAEDPELSETSGEQAQTILRNGSHLLELVNEVLDLAKVESGTMEVDLVEFSPGDLFAETIELLKINARDKGIDLFLEYTKLPKMVRGDAHRLRQILVNLAGNAIKFTDQGSVTIRAKMRQSTGELVCDIIDTGVGIAPERIKELFRPFSQVDSSMSRKHGGTGLGLSISKSIASMLGGDIVVTSKVGKGSTFTVTIPADIITTRGTKKKAAKADRPKLDARILLVEDGRDNQRLFAHILSKAGAEVAVADNGLEGIHQLCVEGKPEQGLQEPPTFDMVLMDMQMPVLDGYSATRQLREMGLRVPIIALTAHAMGEARKECVDSGCDEVATKPIAARALLELCAEWIERPKDAEWVPRLPQSVSSE